MGNILWPNGTTDRPAISSGFGPRNLANPLASTYHRGVDMYGFGTVHAIEAGEVVYVGWYSGVGWSTVAGFMVIVQHDGFFSRSLHTDAGTERVSVGQRVKAGDPLVDMGWSGLQGPWAEHVHLEITPGQWHNGNTGQVDPVPFIEARIGQTGGGGGPTDYDYDSLEGDMTAQADIQWIKDQLGGSNSRDTSLRQDVDRIEKQVKANQADIEWIKDRIGGTYKGDSVTDMLRDIKG